MGRFRVEIYDLPDQQNPEYTPTLELENAFEQMGLKGNFANVNDFALKKEVE